MDNKIKPYIFQRDKSTRNIDYKKLPADTPRDSRLKHPI